MKLNRLLILSLSLSALSVQAQEWMNVHQTYNGAEMVFPLEMSKYRDYDFSSDKKTLRAFSVKDDGKEMIVPFAVENIDSIDFSYDLADEQKGHNKYRPFTMSITTEDYVNIVEKEVWQNCHITIDGKGEYSNYSGTGRIRGRGNSSWEWYDKKPYKFKLDEKSKLLGLSKAKNWNLLANYRDVTDMMNVFAFEAARYMGMPNTNHTRFVEVFLNGEYIGVYQLTEKIEVAKNRVEIDEENGVMLSFDLDDGPSLSPEATDNFWSSVYSLPMCVKYPEDPDAETLESVKQDFAKLEKAVQSRDYALVEKLMDIPSYIGMLQMHEYLFNVEIGAPRSMYMYKDKDGKYTFGPVWDWDAAFDFDWSDMYTGHTFFTDYRELVLGTDPVNATGAYQKVNRFWRDMFGNAEFVKQYKDTWTAISDSVYLAPWKETQKYADAMTKEGAYTRDTDKWPLVKSDSGWNWGGWGGNGNSSKFEPAAEMEKMKIWLRNRKTYMDDVIAAYPSGNNEKVNVEEPEVTVVDGEVYVSAPIIFANGYSQSSRIVLDENIITELIGSTPTNLSPMNADGTTGNNTAAGVYGAWFNDRGTCSWNSGHVYIESNELYSWAYGCHPNNCHAGDKHTVTMQYKYGKKKVNVVVTFTVQ